MRKVQASVVNGKEAFEEVPCKTLRYVQLVQAAGSWHEKERWSDGSVFMMNTLRIRVSEEERKILICVGEVGQIIRAAEVDH